MPIAEETPRTRGSDGADEEASAPRWSGPRRLALAAGVASLLLVAGTLVTAVLLKDGGKADDSATGDRSGGSVTDRPRPLAGAGVSSASASPTPSTTGKTKTHPSAHTSPTGASTASKPGKTTAQQHADSAATAGTAGSSSSGDGTSCAPTTGSGAITDYFACVSSGTVTLQATFNTSQRFYHAFFNTDGDTATGYQLPTPSPSALGADYMIENGVLYRSLSTSWKWTEVATRPTTTVSGTTHTWTLPLSAIGSPTGAQHVEFNAGTDYTPVITFSTN